MSKLKEDLAHIVKMTQVIENGVDENSLADTHFALSMRKESVETVLTNLRIASDWLPILSYHPNRGMLKLIEELVYSHVLPPKEVEIIGGNRTYVFKYPQGSVLIPVQYHIGIRDYLNAQSTMIPYGDYVADTVWAYFKEKVEQYNIIKEPESHVKTH